jgi:hypothetical protein
MTTYKISTIKNMFLKSLPNLPRPDCMTCTMLRYFVDKYFCYIPALWRKLCAAWVLFCCLFWTDIPTLIWADIAASYGLLLLPSMDWYTAFYGLLYQHWYGLILLPLLDWYAAFYGLLFHSVMDWYMCLVTTLLCTDISLFFLTHTLHNNCVEERVNLLLK